VAGLFLVNRSNLTGPADAIEEAIVPQQVSAARTDDAGSEAGRLFLAYLPVVESVTSSVCRHQHLRASERDEFASFVKLALLDRDCEVLRQHTGGGSAVAFLRVVINRLLYDYRCQIWGRWRPTAAAKRHGSVAMLMERLVSRDGFSIDEAIETARTNHGVIETAHELRHLCVTLALGATSRPRTVPETAACDIASGDPTPDLMLVNREAQTTRGRIVAALDAARESLTRQEQLLLKMRVDDGLPVSRIAVALGLNQKKLYVTLNRLYARIRERLLAEGISKEDVYECFGHSE
jgi:RNA polymerase sigma factor for flagellar operon FliA